MQKVFVSYSHKNYQWVSKGDYDLILWLESQLLSEEIEVWWDRELKRLPGIEYEEMIKEKIAEADMAILLLSPEYASSQFIKDIEEPLIKQRYDQGELLILPIVITPPTVNQRKGRLAWMFSSLEVFPDDKRTVIDVREASNAEWSHLKANLVDGILNRFDEFEKAKEERIRLAEQKRIKEEQRAKKEAEKREQERIRREALEKKKQEEREKQIEKPQKTAVRKEKINASIQDAKSSKLVKIAMWLACVIAVIGIGWLSLSLYQNEQKKYLLYLSDSDFEIIEESGKYGFKLKKNDEVVIPIKYSKVENFDGGLARVSNDEKWGLINKAGKLVVPMLYDEISYLYSNYNGLRKVKLGNKYGMINIKGELVIPLEYEYLLVSGDLVDVKKNSKCGFINFQNEEVIPLKYDNTFYFSDGLCGVSLNNKYGYVDKLGNEVIPLIYDSADSFSEGLAAVKKDGKWGYIDTQWNVVIDFAPYDRVWSFGEDGLATVCLYGDYGAIDKTGKVVIPIIYDKQFSFRQGKAEVQLKGQKFVIDITGKRINETK